MKKKAWLFGIIVFTAIFILISILFKIYEINALPIQFYGALIGVVITAIITVLLLHGQTQNEEEREKSVKIFEKKQEVYHSFLERIGQIIMELTEKSITTGNDKISYENIIKLENLIFQFSYLHIHMKENAFLGVIQNLSEVFKTYNEIRLYETYKIEINEQKRSSPIINNNLLKLMQKMSEHLFSISKILNNDLYGENDTKRNTQILNEMKTLFYNCGLRELPK